MPSRAPQPHGGALLPPSPGVPSLYARSTSPVPNARPSGELLSPAVDHVVRMRKSVVIYVYMCARLEQRNPIVVWRSKSNTTSSWCLMNCLNQTSSSISRFRVGFRKWLNDSLVRLIDMMNRLIDTLVTIILCGSLTDALWYVGQIRCCAYVYCSMVMLGKNLSSPFYFVMLWLYLVLAKKCFIPYHPVT
jgi:hypothetical protein